MFSLKLKIENEVPDLKYALAQSLCFEDPWSHWNNPKIPPKKLSSFRAHPPTPPLVVNYDQKVYVGKIRRINETTRWGGGAGQLDGLAQE